MTRVMAMSSFPCPTHHLLLPPLQFPHSLHFPKLPQLQLVACFKCSSSSSSSSSGSEGEEHGNARRPFSGREAAFKVAMPMLAAAILGFNGNLAHAEDWRSISLPVRNLELVKGQDSYETLLQKIQESRQRSLYPQVGENQNLGDKEDSSITSNLRVQKLKDATENARGYGAPWKANSGQASSPVASAKPPTINPQAQEPGVSATKSQKKRSHGFLPLFVSQFLLLVATIGGGAALFVLPDSYWKELQKKLDDNFEKASPYVEETYGKLYPVIIKGLEKTQQVATEAKPYVREAFKAARPMAQQAFEASKPVLKEAQTKASQLLQQAQEKAKSLNQQ